MCILTPVSAEDFVSKKVPELLKKLEAGTPPRWGCLTAQHMVEHIVGSWRISNGKAQVGCHTPEDKLPAYREFLFSNQPYEKNRKNPIMPDGLFPLRKPNLADAVAQLKQEIEDFFAYHSAHPGTIFTHPIFGPLNKEEWLIFQQKHIGHHFTQFRLMELPGYEEQVLTPDR